MCGAQCRRPILAVSRSSGVPWMTSTRVHGLRSPESRGTSGGEDVPEPPAVLVTAELRDGDPFGARDPDPVHPALLRRSVGLQHLVDRVARPPPLVCGEPSGR